MRDGGGAREIEVAEVELMPLFYSRGHGNYMQNRRLKRLRHINMVELTTNFWRRGLPFNAVITSASYVVAGDMKTTHPGCTSQKSDGSHLLRDKQVF